MNQILKYIHNHPQETKRIIGINYEQLMKLIDNALIIDTQKKQEITVQQKTLIKAGGGRKKTKFIGRNSLDFILFTSCTNFSIVRN
jgi:hypothetical protein